TLQPRLHRREALRSWLFLLDPFRREAEREGRAGPGGRGDPEAPAHRLDEPARDAEPKPGPAARTLVQTSEALKDARPVLLGDARAVVADAHHEPLPAGQGICRVGRPDDGLDRRRAVLQGVVEERPDDLVHAVLVGRREPARGLVAEGEAIARQTGL